MIAKAPITARIRMGPSKASVLHPSGWEIIHCIGNKTSSNGLHTLQNREMARPGAAAARPYLQRCIDESYEGRPRADANQRDRGQAGSVIDMSLTASILLRRLMPKQATSRRDK